MSLFFEQMMFYCDWWVIVRYLVSVFLEFYVVDLLMGVVFSIQQCWLMLQVGIVFYFCELIGDGLFVYIVLVLDKVEVEQIVVCNMVYVFMLEMLKYGVV